MKVIEISDSYACDQYFKSIVVKVLKADRADKARYSPSGSQSRGHTRVAEGSQISVDNMS
jgi:hypothetical protein